MPPLRPSDQSLLDRLNALKSTNISLDRASNPFKINPEDGAGGEDVLAARLRVLRDSSASGKGEPLGAGVKPTQPPAKAHITTAAIPPPLESSEYADLFADNDLDDLLDGLDEFTLHDPEFGIEGNGRSTNVEEEKVQEMLTTLRSTLYMPRPSHTPPERASEKPNPKEFGEVEDEDDSEREHMSRGVEKILSQVRDEISLENAEKPEGADSLTSVGGAPKVVEGIAGEDDPTPLQLPTVPSSEPIEPDPMPKPGRRKSLDFENDITTRLASLKGLGSGINLDPFGFPAAPVFRPEDRSASTAASLVTKRAGYTDEDQKTWCIVCLDDASIRCMGCDSDVYCARCWRDMV